VGNSGYPGLSFKFNSGYGQSGPMYLFHNTVDAALPGSSGIDIESPGTWKTIYARNNIWSGTEFALSNANPDQPLDFDYDDLYTTLAGELVWWDGLADRHLNTLAEFQAATGQEMHGWNVVPGFANAAGGDYALDSSSDLIDAGVVIPGINDGYVCAAPDVGAFEYQGCGFTLNTIPSSRAIMPGGVATYTIGVQPIGGFSSTVMLFAANPSPSLTLRLTPTTLSPSAHATVTVTDGHSGTSLLPGLWYTIPITAISGGITQSMSVGLLVGGARVWLPVVLKSYP